MTDECRNIPVSEEFRVRQWTSLPGRGTVAWVRSNIQYPAFMRRFIVRFILASAGTWLARSLVPAGITDDGLLSTYVLMGLFIAVGEVVLHVTRHGAALVLFFLPRLLRVFLLRMIVVAIAASLVEGFTFTPPLPLGLFGTTLLLSLLFLFPFSS